MKTGGQPSPGGWSIGGVRSRFYRGYSLKPVDGRWEIWWGEKLDSADTLEAAEAIVDSWMAAP